jgi:hypothetical protein
MLKWNSSRSDLELISAIADRYIRMRPTYLDLRATVMMDIEAAHCNGCPLRLAEMLVAEDADFLHDVAGIRAHLNRQTGELEDCFSPRFAVLDWTWVPSKEELEGEYR